MKNKLETIANEILKIETLETRLSDNLDFHDVSVWSVKDALEAAYMLGQYESKYKKAVKACEDPGQTYTTRFDALSGCAACVNCINENLKYAKQALENRYFSFVEIMISKCRALLKNADKAHDALFDLTNGQLTDNEWVILESVEIAWTSVIELKTKYNNLIEK